MFIKWSFLHSNLQILHSIFVSVSFGHTHTHTQIYNYICTHHTSILSTTHKIFNTHWQTCAHKHTNMHTHTHTNCAHENVSQININMNIQCQNWKCVVCCTVVLYFANSSLFMVYNAYSWHTWIVTRYIVIFHWWNIIVKLLLLLSLGHLGLAWQSCLISVCFHSLW